jgi:hypothetical protein
MTFLYFAYGSNMLPARLQARCKTARLVGCALAEGADLTFSKISNDGSGKASLAPASNVQTPGALFEIAGSDLPALDKAEGVGTGYERNDRFSINLTANGECVTATTYIATAIDDRLKPYDWYLALVIAGAELHAFGEQHLRRLREFDYLVDTRPSRNNRLDALAALQAHGFADYRSLLGRV